MARSKATRRNNFLAICAFILITAGGGAIPLCAQVNTRLLLASGTEVPGHGGLAFGPFVSVQMNSRQDIVFLTTMRSPRTEIHAVARSTGVSFSVLAFQGLLGPFPRSTYETFSAPSMNDSGVVAFTATLASDQAEVPKLVIVRQEGPASRAVATSLDEPPGQPGAKFEEFSSPLMFSDGSVLFGARWSGKTTGNGLFLWTPRGLQAVALPAEIKLGHREVLNPFFVGHDEAALVRGEASSSAATEQFFRAIANQAFQQLQPPPDPHQTTELLAARPGVPPVQMVLVYFENGSVQTILLPGDPGKPVAVKQSLSTTPVKAVGDIDSVTIGPRGDLIFAAAPADAPSDLALYCDCDGQANRLTTPEDFLSITSAGQAKPISSLTGDTQQTVAFIGPTVGGENTGIYVTAIH